nr:hypothetical protein [uncultured Rhodopila sp.]
MSELQASADSFLADLRGGFADRPTLPAIFQLGDRIAEAERSPIPGDTPTQRIAVPGASTIDYLRRAVACAVLQEGVFPLLYQAPFGACAQEILEPESALHAFGPELVVIASHWRDLIADVAMGCTAAEVDAALEPRMALLRTLWDIMAARGARIIQHLPAPPPLRFRGVAERLLPPSPSIRSGD